MAAGEGGGRGAATINGDPEDHLAEAPGLGDATASSNLLGSSHDGSIAVLVRKTGVPARHIGPLAAFFNMIKAMCGIGTITTPFLIRVVGLVYGVVGLVSMCMLNLYTAYLVLACIDEIRPNIRMYPNTAAKAETLRSKRKKDPNYGTVDECVMPLPKKPTTAASFRMDELGGLDDLGQRAFGGSPWVGWICTGAAVMCQMGVATAMMVFSLTNLANALEVKPTDTSVWAPLLVMFVLLAQFRSTTWMWPSSVLGNIAIVGSMAVVLYYAFLYNAPFRLTAPDWQDKDWFDWTGFPVFYGLVLFVFKSQVELVAVEHSLNDVRAMKKVMVSAYAVTLAAYLFFGIVCFLCFRAETSDLIFDNLPPTSDAVLVMMGLMSIVVLMGFPVNLFPASVIIEKKVIPDEWFDVWWKVETARTLMRAGFVLAMFGTSLILLDQYGIFIAFVSSISDSLTCFVLPAAMHNKLFKGRSPWYQRSFNTLVIWFGLLGSFFSVVLLGFRMFFNVSLLKYIQR